MCLLYILTFEFRRIKIKKICLEYCCYKLRKYETSIVTIYYGLFRHTDNGQSDRNDSINNKITNLEYY